ncbi:hypothetical protein OROHE_024458 [Orobanche hederae]
MAYNGKDSGVALPAQGYPPNGYPPQGYPQQGYPPQAYPPQTYPPQAYPPQQSNQQQNSSDGLLQGCFGCFVLLLHVGSMLLMELLSEIHLPFTKQTRQEKRIGNVL